MMATSTEIIILLTVVIGLAALVIRSAVKREKDDFVPEYELSGIDRDSVKPDDSAGPIRYRFTARIVLDAHERPSVTLPVMNVEARYDDLKHRYLLSTSEPLWQATNGRGYGNVWNDSMFKMLIERIETDLNEYLTEKLADELTKSI